MDNHISFDSFMNLELPKWFIYILLIFVFLWAFSIFMEFLHKKSGVEDKSKLAQFDMLQFLIPLFKYTGRGMLLSCIILLLLKLAENGLNMNLSGTAVLIFFSILILSISKALKTYFNKPEEKSQL